MVGDKANVGAPIPFGKGWVMLTADGRMRIDAKATIELIRRTHQPDWQWGRYATMDRAKGKWGVVIDQIEQDHGSVLRRLADYNAGLESDE